jgi:EAL domain-containing protein (putative c-di-GMP-specific phosphodiesterase class I)
MVVLAELKELGVQMALDDFGTGYSSLGYLEHLPIDSIKIDRQFIAHLSADPGSQVIVNAIIQMAHGLGIAIVAEGVETAQQHETGTNLGSDEC